MKCSKCGAELPEGSVYCCACGKKQVASSKRRSKRANGSGTAVKRGKTWTARIVVGYITVEEDGKKCRLPRYRTKGGFATKTAALEYCSGLKAAPESKAPTLETIWDGWSTSDMTKLSGSKQSAFRIAHGKLEKAGLIFRRIDELRVRDLQLAINEQGTSYYTARDIKTLLSHLYRRAMVDQDVSDNLALVLTLPELEEAEAAPFSEVDQQKLWKAYSDAIERDASSPSEAVDLDIVMIGAILLMINTGMMPGELLGATKDMIDFDRGEIIGAGRKTKTRRMVPIVYPAEMDDVLQRMCEKSSSGKLIRMNKDRFYVEYYAALERAGCQRLPPYSCRHTTGTALGTANLPQAVVQKMMRHAKYQSTQRYIHPDTADLHAAAAVLADQRKKAQNT